MKSKYLLVIIALLGASLFAGAPRNDRWKVIGPGGGGGQFIPTMSPHNAKDVLVACDMTGAYISHDTGDSWRMFNLRGTVRFFAFDPVDAKTIYAGNNALWRSTDSGTTWRLVYPDPSTVTAVHMADDHAGERFVSSAGPGGSIVALAIDPADSKVLYAGLVENRWSFSLQISTDSGKTWKKSADLPSGATKIYVDPKSPKNNRTIYVIGRTGIAVREDGAWQQRNPPPGLKFMFDSAGGFPAGTGIVDASGGFPASGGKLILYALSPREIFVSSDGGQNWTKSDFPGFVPNVRAIATSLNHPDVAYVSYSRSRREGEGIFGVAKTVDRGKSWDLIWKELDTPAPNMADGWMSAYFGPQWGGNPLNIGVSPTDPNVCFGTDYGRTLRTTDGGKTWKGVYSNKTPDGGYTTTGLDVTTNYGVHVDPFNSKRIFIDYTDIGLFRSENGGQSWVKSSDGVPQRWVNTTYWMEFDPQVKGRAWAVMSGVHDLPRPKMWRGRDVTKTYNGGVCRSDNGGVNWDCENPSLPQTAATAILLDRKSPANSRTLYVAGYGRGVFKSIDGGKTWQLKNNGLPEHEPFAWRFAKDLKDVLYVVIARRAEDGIGTEGDGAIYRSTDGAESWTKMTLPEGVNGPNGLQIDPKDPMRMYLAAWGRRSGSDASDGGVFLSTDAGATWKNVLSKDQHVYDVTIDPRNPKILYACGFENSAWRSTDWGLTWKRIKGYNFKWGHRVVPDPNDPKMIYITTFGGSVWHGPAEGDPKAVEDIVTPLPERK